MLEHLIIWSRNQGWKKIYTRASPDIRPLREWLGTQSIKGYLKRGFKEIDHSIDEWFLPKNNPEYTLEGVNSMKKGYHGETERKQWDKYSDLTDEEIAKSYRMELSL